MSESLDEGSCEDLVFECLVKVVSQRRIRMPRIIPESLENLEDDEWVVLAYLQDVSAARKAARLAQQAASGDTRPSAQSTAVVHAADLQDNASSDVVPDRCLAPGPHEDTACTGVSLIKAQTPPPVSGDDADESAGNADEPTDLASTSQPEESRAMMKGPGGIPKTGSMPSQPDSDRVNLKNGRARQAYRALVEGYSGIVLRDDGGTGLTISSEGELSGGEMPAGEYTLVLEAIRSARPVEIRARLSVIADPRDLWKEMASDQTAERAKTDQAFESQNGEAFIVAASKRGRSHAQEGKYRDDDFAILADIDTGWHMLVVADGAGSAELSREGSRIACDVVIRTLPGLLTEKVDPYLEALLEEHDADPAAWALKLRRDFLVDVLPVAALKAAEAIEVEAAVMKRKPQEFSTTIVMALSKKVGGRWFTASFTVGDGGVAVYDADKGKVDVLCRPDSGEFAGQTRFLARSEFAEPEEVLDRIFVDLRQRFTVLAAMTDGVTDPKFPTDAVFASPDAWSAFWANDINKSVTLHPDNTQLETQLLSWLDFWSRGNHDDRTLALMIPDPHCSDESGEGADEQATGDSHQDETVSDGVARENAGSPGDNTP